MLREKRTGAILSQHSAKRRTFLITQLCYVHKTTDTLFSSTRRNQTVRCSELARDLLATRNGNALCSCGPLDVPGGCDGFFSVVASNRNHVSFRLPAGLRTKRPRVV